MSLTVELLFEKLSHVELNRGVLGLRLRIDHFRVHLVYSHLRKLRAEQEHASVRKMITVAMSK